MPQKPSYGLQLETARAAQAKEKAALAKLPKKSKRRSYFEQAVDYGDKSPKPQEEIEHDRAKSSYRRDTFQPMVTKLSTNKWKTEGITSDDQDLADGLKNGYISVDEYKRINNLISSRLVQAHKLRSVKTDAFGRKNIVSGRKQVIGRQFLPEEDELSIEHARLARREELKRKYKALDKPDLVKSNEEVGSMLSGTLGAAAGFGLGAIKSVTKVGSLVNPMLDEAYKFMDENERKYYQGAEESGKSNMFLESMYGTSAGTEQFLAAPFVFGGEAGKYTFGRYIGQLQGMTPQQSDDVHDTLGLMSWYGERTGDSDNLTRQAIRLGAVESLSQAATLGASLGLMNVTGSAFAKALQPVTKNLIQHKAAQTAGSLIPGAVSAAGTAGIPGQVAGALGADERTRENINRQVELASSPLEMVTKNVPLVGKDQYGNPVDYQQQDAALKQQTDPYGVSSTLMTLGMFGSGTAGFYTDAKKLYQVSRMLSRANAAQPGKFAQAGMKLARQKAELIGAVGPDAAFALNNTFTPIAQSYRAATDNAVDENGNKIYNQPTALDISRAAVMTFGAMRPHAKLGPLLAPNFKGKPITGNMDMNAQAYFIAKEFVDGGDWRASVINKRFQELNNGQDAHPDDIKRVVSEIYRRNKPVAMELLRGGKALPQHALESMFLGIATGRGIEHESSEVTQARVDNLIRSMRKKGDDNAHADGNPLTSIQIDPMLYIMNPRDRARQINDVQAQILKEMQASVAEQPTEAVQPEVQETQESAAPKFFAVRIEDAPDGTPQYIAYNSHRSASGHTFRSAEIVRGDQDMSDLIDVSSSGHTANKRLFTAEALIDILQKSPDILNPLTGNKWTTADRSNTRTIAGFRPDGGVIVKQYNQSTGETTEIIMPSTEVARELAEQNPKFATVVSPILEALNTNQAESTDIPDFYESQDFPDRVAYTSGGNGVREVNGRLISTFGAVNPLGVFQLVDGSVYVQPIRDSTVRTKQPMRSRDIDRSPETLNTRTLRQARIAVNNGEGYIDIDINNMGVPTRILMDQPQIELAESILESDLPDALKGDILRTAVAESLALNTAGEKLAYRYAEDGTLTQDAEIQLGDVVVGNFTNNTNAGDTQRAVVIQTDGRLATVKLLTDPEGISYAAPVDQLIVDIHHDRADLQKRLNEFVPSESAPTLRPWKRALSDEEEMAVYVTAKNAVQVQQLIRDANGEDLFGIVQKYVRDATSLPAAVKAGLISWAATNQDVETVLDTLVSLYDDSQSGDNKSIVYMHRVASLYGDTAFLDTLYTIADLTDQISVQAQTSARSIQKAATTRAIARRMNQIIFRSTQPVSVDTAYKRAISSLNIQPDARTERDAKAEAHLMRGIAPHATPYVENVWQMQALSGASLDVQVRLGRALGAVGAEGARAAIVEAGFSKALDSFWESKANYEYALNEVRNEIVRTRDTENANVEERLRALGLDFLYYAAIDKPSTQVRNRVMADPAIYRDFQRQANNHVSNVILPKLIMDAIGESVNDQTFLGADITGAPHETNKLSFLEVLASYGTEIQNLVDKSEIANDSKIDILDALRNLQSQIETDGAAAKRVANYRGNNITGELDLTLKDGDTIVNIPVVDSMIAIDEVVNELMTHAVVDETVSASRTNKDEVALDTIDTATEEGIKQARALVADELRKTAQFAKVVNYLKLFDINGVSAHVNAYAGPELAELKAKAEETKQLKIQGLATQAELDDAYAKYNNLNRETFLRAFSFFDTLLTAAQRIEMLYVNGDAPVFSDALDRLMYAYQDVKSVYTNPDAKRLFSSQASLGGVDVYGGKIIRQSGEDGSDATEEQNIANRSDANIDLDQVKVLYRMRAQVKNDTKLTRPEREARLAEIDGAIAEYKKAAADEQVGAEVDLDKVFIAALDNFNKSINDLPSVLYNKYTNANEDILAMQLVIMKDLMAAMSKDWHSGIAGERSMRYSLGVGRDIKRLSRIQENTMSFYNDIQKAGDVSISSENGEITLTLFGQQHDIESNAEFNARVDRMNESRTKIEPNPTVDDAVFTANAIDGDLAEFVGSDPAVTVHALSSDNGFGGMAKNEDVAKSQSTIYAMHARNFTGMRKLLRQMLANEFGTTLESQRDDVIQMASDPQFSNIDVAMVVNPSRDVDIEKLDLTNPFVARALRTGWAARLANSFTDMVKRGINIEGIQYTSTRADEKVINNIAKRVSDYIAGVDSGTLKTIAHELNMIAQNELQARGVRTTPYLEAFARIFNTDGIINTFSLSDNTGRFGSWSKGSVDVPLQIASTITALQSHKTHAVVFNHGRYGRESVFSTPEADGLDTVSPATAKMMFDLYNSLDLSSYSDAQKAQLQDIKNAYAMRMRDEGLKAATSIAKDAALIDRMATGLAKLYDNFAYGYANDRIQYLLGSNNGQARAEVINGLRAVGVDEAIVQRFIAENNKSFASFLDSYAQGTVRTADVKDVVFPEEKLVAFRTYMLARGRQDYYLNSGKVLFTTQKVMGLTNVAMRRQTSDRGVIYGAMSAFNSKTDRAVHRLMMIGSDMNVYRTAATLAHEMSHSLFYGVSDVNQLNLLDALVGSNAEILTKTEETGTHPLYPVVQQIEAARKYMAENGRLDLQDAWKDLKDVNGISLRDDWHPYAHEIFASGFLAQISKFAMPIANNAALSIDYDAAAIFQEIAGPLQAVWRSLARESPIDILRTVNGEFQQQWTSPIPVRTYTTGRGRTVQMPLLRMNDYVSFAVPNRGATEGSPYSKMYTPKEMLDYWYDSSFGEINHDYGYEHIVNGKRIFAPAQDADLVNELVGLDFSAGDKYWVLPRSPKDKINRKAGDEESEFQTWGKRYQGRIVDQVVYVEPKNLRGQYKTSFVGRELLTVKPYVSQKEHGGVDANGFFTTQLSLEARTSKSTDSVQQTRVDTPLRDIMYVVEVPATVYMRKNGKLISKSTNMRMLVNAEGFMDQDGTVGARLHGYSGDYNPKFAAVLYDMNHRINAMQTAILNHQDYTEQVRLEKLLTTGRASDFARARPQSQSAADRISAYYADQYKHVRAAGVDMRASMTVGRASVEADLTDFLIDNGHVNEYGGLTESGWNFIDGLRQNAFNSMGAFIFQNGLFRQSLGRDMNTFGSSVKYDENTNEYYLDNTTPEYQGMALFFDALENAFAIKGMDVDQQNEFAYQLFSAFSRPLDVAAGQRLTRADRKKSAIDRINEVFDAFNEGLPEEAQINTSYVIDNGEKQVVSNVIDSLEFVMRGGQVGDFVTDINTTALMDIMDVIKSGQEYRFGSGYYETTGSSYVLSRVRDVVFGRNNKVAYNNFMKALASPDPAVNEPAMQLMYATSHILDLQEREINSARYLWNSEFSLPVNAFNKNGAVIIQHKSGAQFEVDLSNNQARPIVQDALNPLQNIYGDVLGNRYPVTNPESRNRFIYASSVSSDAIDINSLRPIEAQSYLQNGEVTIVRNTALHDDSLPQSFYVYRIMTPKKAKENNPKRYKDVDPQTVPFVVELRTNPYKSMVLDENTGARRSVQEYRQQSVSHLIELAANAFFNDGSPETHDRIAQLRKNTIVPREIYIAKMLVAQQQHNDATRIPESWRKNMRDNYRVSEITHPLENENIKITQSATINNARKGTWLSSGEIPESDVQPWNDYEMELLNSLEEFDPEYANDPEAVQNFREQRYNDMAEYMSRAETPEQVIIKRDGVNNQVGIAVEGKDLYMSIPDADYDTVMNWLYSAAPTPRPHPKITRETLYALRYAHIPGKNKLMRAAGILFTEALSLRNSQLLSRDFARPFIQNFLLSLTPKNFAMQFYGLMALLPNGIDVRNMRFVGNSFMTKMASGLLGHKRHTAFGDKGYHRVIDGLFARYGTPGQSIGTGIPFVNKRTVRGKYEKPLISGLPSTRRSYTIADLNDLGLSTQYGEWFEAASAMKALNPNLDLQDIPIQLSQSEYVGKGVLAQRIPLVGMAERAGVASTDILRIKEMLEYCAMVDQNLTSFGSEGATEAQMEYQATLAKRAMARMLNNLSGTPTGNDPFLHPKLRDTYHVASSIYTAPNWGSALMNLAIVPGLAKLMVGAAVNKALEPIVRRANNGIGYNIIDVGPQARFFNDLVFSTTARGVGYHTPGVRFLWTMAKGLLATYAMHSLLSSAYVQQTRAALMQRVSPQAAQVQNWMTADQLISQSEKADPFTVEEQPFFSFDRKWGRVATVGDAQINYPASVTGFHKYVTLPIYEINDKLNEGQSVVGAIGSTLFDVGFVKRLNPLFGDVVSQYTGQQFFGEASNQEHPGWTYYLANEAAIDKEIIGTPLYLELKAAKLMHSRGMSRFSANQQNLQLQNALKDFESMQYRKGVERGAPFDPNVYNLRLSAFGRLIGVENRYKNKYIDDIAAKKVSDKFNVGYVTSEMRKYQYDYPNAFDMVGKYGLSSLITGIPGSGVLEDNQPIPYPMLPTQQVIDMSTRQDERLKERLRGKMNPKFKPFSQDEVKRIEINNEIDQGMRDIELERQRRRDRDE